ncbi:MAG: 1,4-dihydroxy-2-naphthoate polyprenyltransferase [Mangrovibacterium sp.]
MSNVRSWVKAARLRTLPLALSGILVGSGVALYDGYFRWEIFVLAIFTATSLQILSNFANDYGDFLKGTDNDRRVGPTRTMQSGEIEVGAMRKAIALTIILSLILGFSLIYISQISWQAISIFALLGVLCILAAYFYTAGKHSYGYAGLGDLSVFIFFGIIPVSALYFLYAHNFNILSLLPAIGMGCFSTGVLNLNNMRDCENDLASGKITVAGKLGIEHAKFYHAALIVCGWLSILLFSSLHFTRIWQYIFVLALPFFFKDLIAIFREKQLPQLDPFLKKLSLSTLLFAFLWLMACAF